MPRTWTLVAQEELALAEAESPDDPGAQQKAGESPFSDPEERCEGVGEADQFPKELPQRPASNAVFGEQSCKKFFSTADETLEVNKC